MGDNNQTSTNISRAPSNAIEYEEANPIVEKAPVMTKDLAVKLIVAGIIFIVVLFIYAVFITISKAREQKIIESLQSDIENFKTSGPVATNNDLLYKLANINYKFYNMKFTNEEQQKSLLYKLAKLKKQNKDLIFSKTKAFPSVL